MLAQKSKEHQQQHLFGKFMYKYFCILLGALSVSSCNANKEIIIPTHPIQLIIKKATINNNNFDGTQYNIDFNPTVLIEFNTKIDKETIAGAVSILDKAGNNIELNIYANNNDSVLVVSPKNKLQNMFQYNVLLNNTLRSATKGQLASSFSQKFYTVIDSSRKFETINDQALLDKIQNQTLKYFWDFGHPISGLSRERNSTPEIITSGGSGFGLMSIIVGVSRNFINRTDAVERLNKIVDFLKNKAERFHGAYPHWMNGSTGKAIAFSTKDDGADLVETSYLAQGLICAREYFSNNTDQEIVLRNNINSILDQIEWSWFTKGNEQNLYWHWSPNYAWQMNMPIKGWNECLITFVMAGSSKNHFINKGVYTNGWTSSSSFINGKTYFGNLLPLGPEAGGPLFFEHYSFLGINPRGLKDAFADYDIQTINHTKINYAYCQTQKNFPYAYSDSVWGLTASDIPNGYDACSPTNDRGVIAPTAALSSFPYTPKESMAALHFYYYTLGDKLFKEYGFVDAFSIKDSWVADSFLAIDQGPIIVMIENYRTGLLWNLFMNAPEIQKSLKNLGFSSPKIF